MEARTRHRLIGLLLLLVLAAVLTPLLFRSPDQVRVALDLGIPPAPEVTPLPFEPVVDEVEQEAALQAIESARAQTVAAAEQAADSDLLPPPSKRIPAGWAVQVASLSGPTAAEALVSRLRNAGYTAFTREVEQDGRTLYRVLVGPELERTAATQTRERLARDKSFKLDGLVVPYTL